jgi:nitroreductase
MCLLLEVFFLNQYEKSVFDAIYGRRSIRAYLENKEVEHEKIVKLLKAAMAAPSACNIQPWEFIVVTDKESVSDIKKSIEQYGDYNAPLVIVVCGYSEFIPWENDEGVVDCSAAIENMLIAATAMELGSVWIGGFNPVSLRKLLDIPDNVVPVGVVYFGYPAEQHEPRTQYREEAIYWQKYDTGRKHQPAPGNLIYR